VRHYLQGLQFGHEEGSELLACCLR